MRYAFLSFTCLALAAGRTHAADAPDAAGFRIESEPQFLRDYGPQVERVAPGVYQIVRGPLAGRTVTLGEAGLAYDLAALRAETPRTRHGRAQRTSRIRQLEAVQARYGTQTAITGGDVAKRNLVWVFHCSYQPLNGKLVNYTGSASLFATAEYYLSDGGGGLNLDYARARAGGTASVSAPVQVPYGSGSISLTVRAENRLTGQVVQRLGLAPPTAVVDTGYVGSGPSFGHDLTARATAIGGGNCFGYASISDALP